jgi:hypothetical protein
MAVTHRSGGGMRVEIFESPHGTPTDEVLRAIADWAGNVYVDSITSQDVELEGYTQWTVVYA